jgi:hypothetical protein
MSKSVLKGNIFSHDNVPLVPYGRCNVRVFDNQSKRSDDIGTVRYGAVRHARQR